MVYCTLIYALLWMSYSVHFSCATTHSLQYFQTAVIPRLDFPQYTDAGRVDGEPFVYYSSKVRKYIPKTEWIERISDYDPEYWNRETQNQQAEEKIYIENVAKIMQRFNHTTGIHTLQRIHGCEIDEDDDRIVRGYDRLGYDGEDFISLDLQYVTWIIAKPQAVFFKHQLDMTGAAVREKFYLENICMQWLKLYTYYGRDTLERKVPPEVSVYQKHSSPDIVCHATGFYPEEVMLTWQKDGEDLIENVELGETVPNNDGSFQKRSLLKVPVKRLQSHNYTCVVQHGSLEKEIVKPVVIQKGGGSSLRVGIPAAVGCGVASLGASLGFFIWKKKSAVAQVFQNLKKTSDKESNTTTTSNSTSSENNTNNSNGNNTNNHKHQQQPQHHQEQQHQQIQSAPATSTPTTTTDNHQQPQHHQEPLHHHEQQHQQTQTTPTTMDNPNQQQPQQAQSSTTPKTTTPTITTIPTTRRRPTTTTNNTTNNGSTTNNGYTTTNSLNSINNHQMSDCLLTENESRRHNLQPEVSNYPLDI